MEHHRNPEEAKLLYEEHVLLLETIKSKQLNVEEVILGNIGKSALQSQLDLTDTGAIQELFSIDPSSEETVEDTVNKLNAV